MKTSTVPFRHGLRLGVAASYLASIAFGQYIYVVNEDGASVSGYATSGGTLTPLPGSPFATGTNPQALTVDPTGQFLYVTSYNNGPSPPIKSIQCPAFSPSSRDRLSPPHRGRSV